MSDGCPAEARRRGRRLSVQAILLLAALILQPGHPDPWCAGSPSTDEMLRAADATRHPIEEGSILIRATVEVPGEETVVSGLEVMVSGEDRALCVFREGPLAGRKILIVGERVWLLVPGTSRPIPVSDNQRLLGGASIADVASMRLAAEFSAASRPEEEVIDGAAFRVLDLTAKIRKASYAGGTLWVGVQDGLPRRARFTLPSGREAKEVRFREYGRAAGRTVLRRMEIEHLLPSERGMRTILEFVDYESRTLDAGLFDPETARDRS